MLKSPYKGIYISWKSLRSYDDIKIFCKPPGIERQFAISVEEFPEYRKLRDYARDNKLTKDLQETNKRFNQYFSGCLRAIARQYSLLESAKEQIALDRTRFDFAQLIEDFIKFKRVKSKENYRAALVNFWMPLILNKLKLEDPAQWRMHAEDFVAHLFDYRKSDGSTLSKHSFTTYCTPIDEFIKYLNHKMIITNDQTFSVYSFLGFGDTSRMQDGRRRGDDYYSFDDYHYIKSRIDTLYANEPDKKLIGYIYLLTLSTGIRRGNILGLKPEDFKLDHEIPHIELGDNVLDGNARGVSGVVIEHKATKTTKGERWLIPLRQPSPEMALEIAKFIKSRCFPGHYITTVHPTTFTKGWRVMCKDIGVRYIHIHGMRHSVVTNAVINMKELYSGKAELVMTAMTHKSLRTTEKYLRSINPEDMLKGYKQIDNDQSIK